MHDPYGASGEPIKKGSETAMKTPREVMDV